MSKHTPPRGTLRIVTDSDKDPRPPIGPRVKALREALGLTAGEVARRSIVAARDLGGDPYRPLKPDVISHIESDARNKFSTVYPRAVLCEVFGVTRDDFDRYLDGRMSLEQLLEAREAGHRPPARVEARAVRFGDAQDWRKLVQEARRIARAQFEPLELTEETFEELAKVPWRFGEASAIDGITVARWAIAIQQTRARIKGGTK